MSALQISIPFYSGRDYLARAIESVLAQTSPEWRMTVLDDAGPEGDLTDWLHTRFPDPRIAYVRHASNLGMAGNWNAGLESGDAEWVTLLHSDDELLPHYVATMQKAAREYPEASLFFCGARIIDAHGHPAFSFADSVKGFLIPSRTQIVRLFGEEGVAALMRGNFIMCPTVCYARSRVPRFDSRWKMVLDLDFYFRVLRKGAEIVGLPETAYAYRRHSENATTKYTENLLRFEEEVALYREAGAQSASQTVQRVAQARWIIRLNLLYCVFRDLVRLRLGAAVSKIRFLLKRA
jgi:glycosyltransferase involved in cell wall biosynthesis